MQFVISASQVLTGAAGHRFDRGAVLLEGSSIVAVGSREDIRAAAPEATEIAYPTATIIPGLINAHVHLAFDPGPHRLERLTDNSDRSVDPAWWALLVPRGRGCRARADPCTGPV